MKSHIKQLVNEPDADEESKTLVPKVGGVKAQEDFSSGVI